MKKNLKNLLLGVGVCSLGALNMSAAPIGLSGSFDLSGRIQVTQDAGTGAGHILWTSDVGPGFNSEQFTLSGSALDFNGVLVNENGQNTIHNLNNPPQTVGIAFPDFRFIEFTVAGALPDLMLNFINNGAFAAHGCDAPGGAAAVGQICTLPGSPFGFINLPKSAGGCCQSTATFTMSGRTEDLLSVWTGAFSVNFDVPYQTIIAPFLNPTGAASAGPQAYSGTVTITIQAVPEPGTMALLGGGLMLASLAFRRRFRTR